MSQTLAPRSRRYVAAMVLGTALSALGAAPGSAAVARAEVDARAITDISRYCTVCWRNARLNPDCWTDCTQEVFCRLLERIAPQAWGGLLQNDGEERRELLRAIDAVKKRTQRSHKGWSPLPDAVPDLRERPERQRADEREAVRRAAALVLSTRQQQILQWSFEGWSVHEISDRLRLPPERVSDEKYKAIRKLRARLAAAEAAC